MGTKHTPFKKAVVARKENFQMMMLEQPSHYISTKHVVACLTCESRFIIVLWTSVRLYTPLTLSAQDVTVSV